MLPDAVDVLVVGAGISGIDLAYRLQTTCPGLGYAILEARDAVGGTWDLFRYPGIRSDSDMFTMGFPFEPWRSPQSLGEGRAIRDYVEGTARKYGIHDRIRFGHKVVRASWDSGSGRWTVECHTPDGPRTITARWLHAAAGYYSYDEGYTPDFPGREAFAGTFVHPQAWPEGIDVAGRKVVVIGSGATAVSLVPALADRGADVTMLQRSPSYVMPLGGRDAVAAALQRVLPPGAAHRAMRVKNAAVAAGFYRFSRRAPRAAARLLTGIADKAVRGTSATRADFTPRYNPWDQRICFVPDGDLFAALRSGRARVVTDTIARFEEDGIRTTSGELLEADVVVSATGLRLQVLGGVRLEVDDEEVRLADRFLHRGVMVSGVPNLSTSIGYVNASWTLRADLVAQYVCRLLLRLDATNAVSVRPVAPPGMARRDAFALTSGYVQRARGELPAQGDRPPWTITQSWFADRRAFARADLDDGLAWTAAAVGGVA
jgi:cation diffusion facilitator CzcD-associated flavoprotein CzcO